MESALTPEFDKPETEDQEKLWEEVFLMITDAHVLTPILDKLMKEYTITRKQPMEDKRLEDAANNHAKEVLTEHATRLDIKHCKRDFKAGAEWQAEWISVNDRLPEASTTDGWRNTSLQSDDVLVWESERMWFGYYSLKGGSWIVPGRMGGIEVTHWQPLPRKPLV